MDNLATGNLYRLRVFLEVADVLSFSRAARRLAISQPAVSRHIKELEQALATTLFDRRKGALALTDTGESAYRYARRMISLAEDLKAEMAEARNASAGAIKIGGSDIWAYVLPGIMGEYQRRHPRVAVKLTFRTSRELVAMMLQNELGLAFVSVAAVHPDLEVQQIAQYEFLLAAAADHPLANGAPVTPKALDTLPFLQYETATSTPLGTSIYLAELGVTPNVVMELGRLDAIKQAVEAGFGLAMLPAFTIAHELADGRLAPVRLDAPPCTGALYSVRNRTRYFSPTQQAVLRYLATRLKDEVSRPASTYLHEHLTKLHLKPASADGTR